MKWKGPVLTFVSGLVVGGVLIGLALAVVDRGTPSGRVGAVRTGSTAATTPSAAATAAPSATSPAAQPPDAAAPSVPGVAVTFAGRVAGGAASIAIVVRDGRTVAYVCDGSRVEAWLQGPAAAGQVNLTGATGATLAATFADGFASGTINATGRQWTFRVAAVQAPSGLYRAAATVANARVVGGWIVVGSFQVGMVNRAGTGTTAPPLDTASGTVTIDGTTMRPTRMDGSPLG